MSVKTRIALFAALALFATKCCAQETELELTLEGEQIIPEGASTTVVCTITNNVVGGFLRWEKIYTDEDGLEVTVAIGTNGNIENEFKVLLTESGERRYTASIAQVESSSTFVAKLVFAEMKAEDGGRYRCVMPSVNNLAQSVDITVEVPPSYMQFDVTHNGNPVAFEKGDEVMFEESDTLSLSCIVTGGHPAAAVNVTIGRSDVTDSFTRDEVPKPEYMTPRGLVKITHDVTLTTKEDIVIGYDHAGKNVACKAGLPNGEIVESTSFRIKMTGFPPMFNCENTTVYSNSYEKDLEIECRVKAEPLITEAYYYFYKYGDDEKTVVTSGMKFGSYEMKEMEVDEDTQETILTIYFPVVSTNMFREYTLVAVNDIGETEQVIELAMDEEKEPDFTGGARVITTSVISMLFASLLCLLHL